MSDTRPTPAFRNRTPRILLLTSQYFLIGELKAACVRLDIEHRFINLATKEMTLDAFVTQMTEAFTDFKPDFVLTVNHLGVDHEGVLATLLRQHGIPLASWFVDNPHLILGAYSNLFDARTALFTWDSDTVGSLEDLGFANVFYLPLGADPTRFTPRRSEPVEKWRAPISFVGNSMLTKTLKRLETAIPPPRLIETGMQVAKAFSDSGEPHAGLFLRREFPELIPDYEALQPRGRQLSFDTFITWQATMIYRLDCVLRIMEFSPLIVGDPGWHELLKGHGSWRYHSELSYYSDLPDFYPLSAINFNCTSQQMKGAVNQRVFDVPCCGAFLLTDYRRQMEDLFEPGKEIVAYHHPDEIPGLVGKYLGAPDERQRIAEAARKRILAEHTYDHRMAHLIETMRQTFDQP